VSRASTCPEDVRSIGMVQYQSTLQENLPNEYIAGRRIPFEVYSMFGMLTHGVRSHLCGNAIEHPPDTINVPLSVRLS
jgi:hypothetical protein